MRPRVELRARQRPARQLGQRDRRRLPRLLHGGAAVPRRPARGELRPGRPVRVSGADGVPARAAGAAAGDGGQRVRESAARGAALSAVRVAALRSGPGAVVDRRPRRARALDRSRAPRARGAARRAGLAAVRRLLAVPAHLRVVRLRPGHRVHPADLHGLLRAVAARARRLGRRVSFLPRLQAAACNRIGAAAPGARALARARRGRGGRRGLARDRVRARPRRHPRLSRAGSRARRDAAILGIRHLRGPEPLRLRRASARPVLHARGRRSDRGADARRARVARVALVAHTMEAGALPSGTSCSRPLSRSDCS